MSRNADEGYRLYIELMKKGISLIFRKERRIDTDEYKRRTQNYTRKGIFQKRENEKPY